MNRSSWRSFLVVLPLLLAGLACTLFGGADTAPTPSPTPAAVGAETGAPTVLVLWPPDGSEFVVGQEVVVRVSASDSVGVTRVELRSASSVLSSVPSPEANGQPSLDALLSWRPTRSGPQALQVIAYRRRTASAPVALTLNIHQRASEVVATPIPFGEGIAPPVGPQPGAICQVRVDVGELRYRAGPSTDQAILGFLELGETLSVTGRNAAGTWWRINREGQTAWVSSDSNYTTPLTDCANAPVVE